MALTPDSFQHTDRSTQSPPTHVCRDIDGPSLSCYSHGVQAMITRSVWSYGTLSKKETSLNITDCS
jgi:hypothetical protein